MLRVLSVIAPTIVVGVAAGVVTTAAHQGDPSFVFEQQHPSKLQLGQLAAIVQTTREPIASGQGSAAVSARCVPGSAGPKLNPWHCTVRYASGDSIAYRVVVQLSGRFHGVDNTGTRTVDGCCVRGGNTPTA